MRVTLYLLTLMSCFGLFFLMMKVKGDVSTQLQTRADLVREQRQLQEDLEVLKAEYAHLTNFERMTGLATQLELVPLKVGQLENWENLR